MTVPDWCRPQRPLLLEVCSSYLFCFCFRESQHNYFLHINCKDDTDQSKKPPPNRKVKASKEKIRQIGSFAPLKWVTLYTKFFFSCCPGRTRNRCLLLGTPTLFCVLLSIYFYDSDRKFLKRSKELRIKNKSFFTHCNPFFLQGLH